MGFPSRESEGSFEYGNYWTEVDDLHAVAQHFRDSNRVIRAIVGHSKGILVCLFILKYFEQHEDVKIWFWIYDDVLQFILSFIANFPLYTSIMTSVIIKIFCQPCFGC